MEAKTTTSIDKLVGKTVRVKAESHRPEAPEYYQGKLDRFALSHMIWEPEVTYPDGTRKQITGFRTVRQRDLDEGRVEVIDDPVRKTY